MLPALLGAWGFANELADRLYAAKSPAEQQVDALYGPGVFQVTPRPIRPVTLFDQIAFGDAPDDEEETDAGDAGDEQDDEEG